MNELKPEYVMRALECCVDTKDLMACQDCPYYGNEYCVHRLSTDALALLREKDAEIERIKTHVEQVSLNVRKRFMEELERIYMELKYERKNLKGAMLTSTICARLDQVFFNIIGDVIYESEEESY